jgi:hypothetical protein
MNPSLGRKGYGVGKERTLRGCIKRTVRMIGREESVLDAICGHPV